MQFITISVDSKAAYHDWKYALAKYDLMHLVNLVTFEDDKFQKNYHFTGVPRYMIIDPQGRIVTTSAPSASSASMERLIAKTLREYDATNELTKLAVEEYNEEAMMPYGSKYYRKYVAGVNNFSPKEKIAEGKEKIRSILDKTINDIMIVDDPKAFNPKNIINITNRIMEDYTSVGFEKDTKYYYVQAINLLSKNEIVACFDILKENIFKKGLFDVANFQDMIFLGRVALYPYKNLGLEESRVSMAKIEEIIDAIKNDKQTVNYLKGYINKYENKIKYILTDIEIEKQ